MASTGNIVHGLWISGQLSPLEMLTVSSYVFHGYEFILWTYDQPENYQLPKGAKVLDANDILDRKHIFSYKNENQFGHGKGSFAGFSDIFRYKLLYDKGGWWTDMDITCLQRLDVNAPYVFRKSKSDTDAVVGNIMHVPMHSELMKNCFDAAILSIDENNTDWMAPIKILNEQIVLHGLQAYILTFTNDDSWPLVAEYLHASKPFDKDWKAFHWMNEEFRRIKVPKNEFLPDAAIQRLLLQFNVPHSLIGYGNYFKYRWKLSRWHYGWLFLKKEKPLAAFKFIVFQLYIMLFLQYEKWIKPHVDLGKPFRKSR